MKKINFYLVLPVLLFTGIACATLSEKGKLVKYVTKQEAPKECKLIAEIEVGGLGSLGAASVGQLKIKMRNETGEKGGSFLVIDTIEAASSGKSGTSYSGTGRAYNCP